MRQFEIVITLVTSETPGKFEKINVSFKKMLNLQNLLVNRSTDLNSLHLVSPNTTDTAQWFEIVNC
jgi:hypothetical protein